MRRSTLGWISAAVLSLGGAALAYVFWFAGGSGEPSAQLTTPALATTSTSGDPSEAPAGPTTTARQDVTTVASASGGSMAFVIDQARSTASFQIDEVLRGQPSTVVGTTDQVVGQVAVDLADLGAIQFSDVVINARTFATDAEQRNRAIRGPAILDSATDEFD